MKLRNGEIVERPSSEDITLEDSWLDFTEKSPLDLNPVGCGSALDDYFAMAPEEVERPNRGDSGGSDHHIKEQPDIIVEELKH